MVKNLLTLLCGLIVAFLLTETLLRIFPSKWTGFGTDISYKYDPDIGKVLAPDQRKSVFAMTCFKNKRIRTNSVGFRDDDWNVGKERFRIAVLGDSYMEALQVPDGKCLADLLEEKYAGDAEVMNFGISGYGTLQEYLIYKKYARRYKPDVVLLFFTVNDIVDNSRDLRGAAFRRGGLSIATGYIEDGKVRIRGPDPVGTRIRLTRLRHFIKKNCKLMVALKRVAAMKRMRRKPGKGVPLLWRIYIPMKDAAWTEAWQLMEHFLVRLQRDVRADGAALIVFIVPEYLRVCDDWRKVLEEYDGCEVPAEYSLDYPVGRLRSIAQNHEIHLIDLAPHFIRYKKEHDLSVPYFYFNCDGHFNELGHEVAAGVVYEVLKASDPGFAR